VCDDQVTQSVAYLECAKGHRGSGHIYLGMESEVSSGVQGQSPARGSGGAEAILHYKMLMFLKKILVKRPKISSSKISVG